MTSPKTSNPRSKKQASFEAPEPSEVPSAMTESTASTGTDDVPVKPKSETTEGLEDGDNVFESDSSESDDDDEVTGLTEEEEKERQREKREKVNIKLLMIFTLRRTLGHIISVSIYSAIRYQLIM